MAETTDVAAVRAAQLDQLCRALVAVDDASVARNLLEDLCSPREIDDLAQRLEVARMLDAGVSYVRIQSLTGASATTVARVARCLKFGAGGYRAVLDALPPYDG
jgi:TrpR-related protein YerC/YecD